MKCYICNNKLNDNFKIGVSNTFSYLLCKKCGAGTLFPKPDSKTIYNLYNKKTYFKNLSAPIRNNLLQWFITRRIFKTPSEWIAENFEPAKVLDVGCGNGEFVKYLQNKGWDVYGTDLSPEAVKNSSHLVGKERIRVGVFHKQEFNQKYDMVSFWHVLEHIDNPLEYLNKANKILRKNGVVVAESPNFDSINLNLFRKFYSWIMVPDHVIYYNERAVRVLAQKTGFRVKQIIYPPRALTNFSLSINKFLSSINCPKRILQILFFFSLPFSIIIAIIFSTVGKGEIIRFVLIKK